MKKFRDLPEKTQYALSRTAAAFAVNCLAYYLGKLLGGWRAPVCMAIDLDGRIPVLPWTVLIYVASYAFWAVGYYIALRSERERARRFLTAHIIGECVCLLFFIFLPTTAARPELDSGAPFEWLLRLIYALDTPTNLLPSIHCYMSWMCWLGVRGEKRVPLWYRAFALVFALAVCASTLTTKQHVFADVPAGVVLAEMSWMTSRWLLGRFRAKQGR